jgi:hypothetical protein
MFVHFAEYYSACQTKEDMTDGACCMHGKDEKRNFFFKSDNMAGWQEEITLIIYLAYV